jgi:hypothetical protein
MPDAHDIALGLHVATGVVGLVLGPLSFLAERQPPYRSGAGLAYHLSVLAVALTALGLVAFDPAGLWWLSPLAALAYGLALLGVVAPRRRGANWIRHYVRGQGGSYIALVTALLVVSVPAPFGIAAWLLPTLVGHRLIERRVARISRRDAGSVRHEPASDPPLAHGHLPGQGGVAMRVLAISGSLRSHSHNTGLLSAAAEEAPEAIESPSGRA